MLPPVEATASHRFWWAAVQGAAWAARALHQRSAAHQLRYVLHPTSRTSAVLPSSTAAVHPPVYRKLTAWSATRPITYSGSVCPPGREITTRPPQNCSKEGGGCGGGVAGPGGRGEEAGSRQDRAGRTGSQAARWQQATPAVLPESLPGPSPVQPLRSPALSLALLNQQTVPKLNRTKTKTKAPHYSTHQMRPGLPQVRVEVDRNGEQAASVGGEAKGVPQGAAVGRKAAVVDDHPLGPACGSGSELYVGRVLGGYGGASWRRVGRDFWGGGCCPHSVDVQSLVQGGRKGVRSEKKRREARARRREGLAATLAQQRTKQKARTNVS